MSLMMARFTGMSSASSGPDTLCVETWRKYNPNYEVIFMYKENYSQYVDIPDEIAKHPNFNDSHARFADLIRLYVLAEHGGVWCDASILLKDSLDNWLFPHLAEFAGFYFGLHQKEGFPPQLITWCFACCVDSPFMKLWRDEFIQISNYNSIDEYVESRRSMGVDFQNIHDPNYLACDVASQKVFQIDKYPYENFIIRKAEDTAVRYLHFHEKSYDDDRYENIERACLDKSYQTPILKFFQPERQFIIDHPSEFSNERCGWSD